MLENRIIKYRSIIFLFIIFIGVLWHFDLIDKLCCIPLILLCFIKGQKEDRWFNPFVLLIVTIVSFLVYFDSIAPFYLRDMENSTRWLIVCCLYALFAGMLFVPKNSVSPIYTGNKNENFYFVFCIGLLPAVLSFVLYGNTLSLSGDDLTEMKSERVIPVINELYPFLYASIIVSCKNDNFRQFVLSAICSILAALLSATKSSIFITFLFIVIGCTSFSPFEYNLLFLRIKKYVWLIIPLSCLFLFFFTSNRKNADSDLSYLEKSQSEVIGLSNNSDIARNLFNVYLYYCSPWSNLDYNIAYNYESGKGVNTFGQFPHRLGIEVSKVEKMNPTFLNTHSFITDFYIDFGWIGSVIASFLLGMLIYIIYLKFGLSDDSLMLAFYCIVAKSTILLFFSNHFTMGGVLNSFLSYGLYYLIFMVISSFKDDKTWTKY